MLLFFLRLQQIFSANKNQVKKNEQGANTEYEKVAELCSNGAKK